MSSLARCAACGVDLMPDSAFCHACGSALSGPAASRLRARGELKRITVLFIDAFGAIGPDERLDAEQWHDVTESFFSVVSSAVHQFGGTIDRLTGEGIKVLFGAPAAIESHATQACHAALYLARRLGEHASSFRARAGVEFSVRMGLNSGEVVFGRVGASDFTSQGHPAALAARMQQIAAPGQTLLSEHTAALVKDFFDLRAIGSLPVRNAQRKIRAFELLGARAHRTRLDAARDRGLTPFVGRESEMRALEHELARASGSEVRVVGICGEPGIGKSRLVEEFVEQQRARGLEAHFTRCVEHARWIPFHAATSFLCDALGVAPKTDPRAARAHVERTLGAIDESLLDAMPVIRSAIGLADEEGSARAGASSTPVRDLARTIRSVIEQRNAPGTALIILDDQQWMDAGSDAVFSDLVREPPRTSILVLVTYRRGHQRPWMRYPTFGERSLPALDPRAMRALVRALLGDDRSLGALRERLVERAAGNPFFVEETILALVDSGGIEGQPGRYRVRDARSEVVVPGSLHGVLASRIDLLGEREKTVLQTAAVIGREFPVALLAAVLGCEPVTVAPTLGALEAADFVAALGWGGDPIYHFRHPLLRETVYRSLLRDHRAATHRLVVREMQRLHGEQVDEHAAQLALHAEAAGDLHDAARWHRRAARDAVRWDPLQGLEHWRRVLASTRDAEDDEGCRLRLHACEAIVRLGFHQGLATEDAEHLVREGHRIAERIGDLRTQALLSSAAGSLRGVAGDLSAAIAHHVDALTLAERTGDAELAMMIGSRLVLGQRVAGRLHEALRLAEGLLARHRSPAPACTPGLVSARQLELARAVVLIDLGNVRQGATELDSAITALRGESAPMILGWALALTATVIRHSGDDAPALVSRVEEGYALAQRLAVPSLLGRALCSLATVRLCQDRWEEARVLAEEACETMRELGHAFYVDFDPKLILSYARFGLADVAGARAAARDAMHDAFASGSQLGQLDTMLAYARILARYGTAADREEARHLLRHGLAMVRRCRARSREPFYWFELAGMERRAGNEARAHANQRRGGRLFVAMNAMGHLRRSPGLMDTPADRARPS